MRRTPIKRTTSPRLATAELADKPKRPRDTGPSPRQRAIVYARSGGRCEFPFCERPGKHVQHRRARGAGGDPRPETNQPSNLLHWCVEHHLWAESYRDEARLFGLAMPWSTPDPSQVPVVTRHSSGPVLLDNEGGWTRVD